MPSITSANAILTLAIPLLFPTPVQLQGFAADDVYDIPRIKSVETLMGVDGVLSGGLFLSLGRGSRMRRRVFALMSPAFGFMGCAFG